MIKWINKKRNKKGFTLVELVVVVAILGILAAVAIPRLTSSRDKANRAAVLANLRTIESAITMADVENEGGFVLPDDSTEGNLFGLTGHLAAWPKGPGADVTYAVIDDGDEHRAVVDFKIKETGVYKKFGWEFGDVVAEDTFNIEDLVDKDLVDKDLE